MVRLCSDEKLLSQCDSRDTRNDCHTLQKLFRECEKIKVEQAASSEFRIYFITRACSPEGCQTQHRHRVRTTVGENNIGVVSTLVYRDCDSTCTFLYHSSGRLVSIMGSELVLK